jgi:hypothetical protein
MKVAEIIDNHMMKDKREIVADYLNDNEYDGLFMAGECACSRDDIMPCEEYSSECEPGYRHDVPCADCREFPDQYVDGCGDESNDFVICPHKRKDAAKDAEQGGCPKSRNMLCTGDESGCGDAPFVEKCWETWFAAMAHKEMVSCLKK